MNIPDSSLPKVSVITPSYNSAQTIEACLKSVAGQSYQNKEHLIIDGQSKDETIKIVKKYQALYPHIRFVSEPDKGVWDAMNKGIDLSASGFILWVEMTPCMIMTCLQAFLVQTTSIITKLSMAIFSTSMPVLNLPMNLMLNFWQGSILHIRQFFTENPFLKNRKIQPQIYFVQRLCDQYKMVW